MPSSLEYECVTKEKGQKLPNLCDVIYEPPLGLFISLTQRIVSILKRVYSTARPEELDRRLDMVIAIRHIHNPALEQPVNGNGPSSQGPHLGKASLGVSQVLERADMLHSTLLYHCHGVVKVSTIFVNFPDDWDQAVVATSYEDLSGIDGHDVGVLQVVLVDVPHALVMACVLLAQDWPVVASEGLLIPQVISGCCLCKGLALVQLLVGEDTEHDVVWTSG